MKLLFDGFCRLYDPTCLLSSVLSFDWCCGFYLIIISLIIVLLHQSARWLFWAQCHPEPYVWFFLSKCKQNTNTLMVTFAWFYDFLEQHESVQSLISSQQKAASGLLTDSSHRTSAVISERWRASLSSLSPVSVCQRYPPCLCCPNRSAVTGHGGRHWR